MKQYRPLVSLIGMVGGLLLALPAEAAQFRTWRFDPQQNRLEFSTDAAVQPRAQLLFNPTRIVVDLPGTTLQQRTINQIVGGAVQSVRIGQFDAQTTRLVIELAPGYTLNPDQVVVRGETPQQWVVQLPPSQGRTAPSASTNQVNATPVAGAATQVEGVRTTPDGFFIRTSGASPNLTVKRVSDTQVVLQLENATVAALTSQTLPTNGFGVTAWNIQPVSAAVPTLQITLTVPANSADWQASVSNGSGIVVLPPREVAIAAVPASSAVAPAQAPAAASPPIAVQPPPQAPVVPPQPEPAIPATPVVPPPSSGIPKQTVTIVIDPGHGGRDPGAIGVGGLREKDVTSTIAYEVARILQQSGAQVILTRSDDREIGLEPRVQIAEQANADLFVSIHANSISLSRPEVNGLETYYHSSGNRLAQVIHQSILRLVTMPDRGVRQARFHVLVNTSMPSVLVETGFVTGAQDARNFNDPAWRSRMAQGIAAGIMQYAQRSL
ncbi:N-acetylmuramoyl-L-alanine amidase [Leptolyngbya sp. CCNP1308]|uniref:N-acetylmuramoyl-L-alanine amidase n=1 Tax=Leptolyngbya sp. CCNP1308 TaxID=3110255 RepID=UPI002B21F883|nr:N-acetylmuramoyl-L-alanine amidase [Leptolyngbya sp. CCNP1308]MEA5446976.1 N-acetylmuramoyl-L-alanine amidase [Leptolyngbya sp. CCNP1308]